MLLEITAVLWLEDAPRIESVGIKPQKTFKGKRISSHKKFKAKMAE